MAAEKQLTKKTDMPPHYLVTVAGVFIYTDEGQKKHGTFKYTIPVPVSVTAAIPVRHFDKKTGKHEWTDEVKTINVADYGILSYLIKEKRIQRRILKDYPTFMMLKKHEILETLPSNPDLPLPSHPHCLSKLQLIKFIKSNGWPIDIKLFNSLKELREAVMNYKESPDSYNTLETLIKRRKSSGAALNEVQDELEALYNKDNKENEGKDSIEV